MTAIQSYGSACTVEPGHHGLKKLLFQSNCFALVLYFLWLDIHFHMLVCWSCSMAICSAGTHLRYSAVHLLGWPRGIQCTLCFLHIKIMMWKSGLQNLEHSECAQCSFTEATGLWEIYTLICRCSKLESGYQCLCTLDTSGSHT